ncbi:hypothetical protein [Roseateles sp.]|uniref:hypothetical protein n=1 Tax=Roseateles sp. TaxID=1971397 RepID=UPI003D11E33B
MVIALAYLKAACCHGLLMAECGWYASELRRHTAVVQDHILAVRFSASKLNIQQSQFGDQRSSMNGSVLTSQRDRKPINRTV